MPSNLCPQYTGARYGLKEYCSMSIFHEARAQSAFLKMGIFGEAGSGKTFTSTRVAIGLYHLIKSDKPVFFMDTETGSDFVSDRFGAEMINLQVAKTRAFTELLKAFDEIPSGSILVIDSITHYWNELIESYLKRNNKTRLTLKDWQPLKATWREYSDRFVNSTLHIIVAGRSADKWDEVEDEDGAKELRKVGTKMRVETEFGYEPSLLVEMEMIQASARSGATSAIAPMCAKIASMSLMVSGSMIPDSRRSYLMCNCSTWAVNTWPSKRGRIPRPSSMTRTSVRSGHSTRKSSVRKSPMR